jgi:hypothetical protein
MPSLIGKIRYCCGSPIFLRNSCIPWRVDTDAKCALDLRNQGEKHAGIIWDASDIG